MSTDKDALQVALDHFNAGNLDEYMKLFDASVVMHGAGPEPLRGCEQIRVYYLKLLEAFSKFYVRTEDMIAEGDRVACRFTMTGSHTGPFFGTPATGRDVTASGITVLRFVDGKCVERWNNFDVLRLLMQIGALPAPA